MPVDPNSFDEVWKKISVVIENILHGVPLTRDEYWKSDKCVDKYFNGSDYNESLLRETINLPKDNSKKRNYDEMNDDQLRSNIPGSQMYFSIKKKFDEYIKHEVEGGSCLSGAAFLEYYYKLWEKYQFATLVINGICRPLNMHWIPRRYEAGIKCIDKIHIMAMKIWESAFFTNSNKSPARICIELIKEERDGKRIDRSIIRSVLKSYLALDFHKAYSDKESYKTVSSLMAYREHFEKEFIKETNEYFCREAEQFLETNSFNSYLRKVAQRFEEEESRIEACLHPSTHDLLTRTLLNAFISNHMPSLYEEALNLIADGKLQDLHIVFELLNRMNSGHEQLQQDFKQYVYKSGIEEIDKMAVTGSKDPKSYIDNLIEIHTKFDEVVSRAFSWQCDCQAFCRRCGYKTFKSEADYRAAFDKACIEFINKNAVLDCKDKPLNSAEMLARYCDLLLRRGEKMESDVEGRICQIMNIFNYIRDKDIFQKWYGKLLAKRLIEQSTASYDYEESLIAKLKAICGFEYSSKLQRMFEDIRLSTTLMEKYRTFCQNSEQLSTIEFSAMVLTSHSWPFTIPSAFHLPSELQAVVTIFQYFYARQYAGRKLDWLWQHSRGDLYARYAKQKYTFQASIYQLTVLLLFNEVETITVQRILDLTQIETKLLLEVLASLLKKQVLLCEQIPLSDVNDNFNASSLIMSYEIRVNQAFQSKKVKINLAVVLAKTPQSDQMETKKISQSVIDDRKLVIQATIVRIMKTRQQLKHNLLIEEVMNQLHSRFPLDVSSIKFCIELLIEKEYLERSKNENGVYQYLA